MRMSLQFWDDTTGLDLNGTDFEATEKIGAGNGMAPAQEDFIDLGESDPYPGGKTLSGSFYTFQVRLKGSGDAAIEVQRDLLNKWFRPNDFTFRKLVGYDVDNSNKDWYLLGRTVTPPTLEEGSVKNLYNITIALQVPYWIEYDLNTDNWTVDSDTETKTMTSVGNMPALPTFEITPVQAKASNDLKYKTFYAIHTSGWGGTKIPIDITDGGLDTASLTTAKMRADGYDVGVSVNGVYVDRWFGEFDTASTKIWINLNFKPVPAMTLNVALAGSGVPATLKVEYVSGSITLAQNSTLQIGSELITYSSYTVNAANKIITFVPTLRKAKGSSIASHSVGDAVYWIENEIWLTYGNSSAPAPVINDANKPTIDLDDSTNDSWVSYEYGNFTNIRSVTPGFYGAFSELYTHAYTGDHGANADPFTELGLYLSSTPSGNIILNNIKRIAWILSHPGGISHFAANGESYRSGENFPDVYLSNKAPGSVGDTYVIVPPPASAATWDTFSISETLADNPKRVFFIMWGALGTTLPAPYAMAELDDLTLTVYDPPTISAMGVEQANYKLTGSLVNDTTDAEILFNDLITKTGNTITIDCAEQEVYSEDGKRLRGMIKFGGPKRDDWMTFVSGANSIVFTDVGTVELDIVTKWRGRNTI